MGKIKKIKAERKRAEVEKRLNKVKTLKRTFAYSFVLLLIFGVGFGGFTGFRYLDSKGKLNFIKKEKETAVAERKTYTKPQDMKIDTNKKYVAKMETTKGTLELELNAKDTPITVNNFVVLSRDNFYNDTKFHRIIKDFMIQGGDPLGTGSGGPGYKFDDEEFSADYLPGTLAMANSGEDTNGSQFFIMTGDYSGGKLPKNYTIFGKVINGMDVLSKIAETPTTDNGQGENSKPLEEIKIIKIEIIES